MPKLAARHATNRRENSRTARRFRKDRTARSERETRPASLLEKQATRSFGTGAALLLNHKCWIRSSTRPNTVCLALTISLEKFMMSAAINNLLPRPFPDSARLITAENIAAALTVFVSSLPTNKSRVERYLAGDQHALTDLEKEGMTLFRGRAQCAQCHLVTDSAAGISDRRFHSVGIGIEAAQLADLAIRALKTVEKDGIDAAILLNTDMSHLGRFLVTKEPRDIGKFKTPGLRHASITSPYMHDGSVPTLEEALDRELYYRSLASGTPLALTNDERAQLLAFRGRYRARTSELPDYGHTVR